MLKNGTKSLREPNLLFYFLSLARASIETCVKSNNVRGYFKNDSEKNNNKKEKTAKKVSATRVL